MATAERLERMTDRGKFEILANAVLRRANPDYNALITHGINAQGETIASVADGFCKVPDSDPPRFVWFQHTTTDRSNLRAKWLSASDENPGDLIKAAREATRMKAKLPDAQFTVVLSTNQRIDDDLTQDVYVKAHELGVEADPWEQSRYADFLDNEPVGQYLRHQHLGIDTEMLSPDLLGGLNRKSLEEYAAEEFQFLSPDLWVPRQLDIQISRSVQDPICALVLLPGEAGFGKSAAAYRFLVSYIANGGYGLRVPESIAQASVSLDDMLRQTFQRLCPSLAPEEVARIPDLMPPGDRFIVLVDDVNRTPSPPVLVRKLAGWAREPYLIVCPLWPRFRAQLMDLERRQDVSIVLVERMHSEEASCAIQAIADQAGMEVSAMEAGSIAESLGYDPFLIGMLGQAIPDTVSGQRFDTLIADTLAQCIQRRIGEVVGASIGRHFPHEFEEALLAVASGMLRFGELRPSWTEVESWLQQDPNRLDALRNICLHGRLCHVSPEGEFRFLHDRFLQYFCVEAIAGFLDDFDVNSQTLSDPAYAEWIARALLRAPQDEDLLDTIREHNPLALVSAIRYMGTPSTAYHRLIIRKVKEWVYAYAGPYSSGTPESLRWDVALSFVLTDSPVVLDIVHTDFGLPYQTWLGGFARFRNGDPKGALKFCSIFGLFWQQEGHLFIQLVEHAALHHRDLLMQGLTDVLRNPQERHDVDGAPILAGFLGFPELRDAIRQWWSDVDDKPKYLVEALWAALRCSDNPHEDEFLDSMVTHWAELPDVEEENRQSKREGVGTRLLAALPRYADDELVCYLIEQAHSYDELLAPIAHICCKVDLLDAIEFALRTSAEMPDTERVCTGSSWPSVSGMKLSRASVERLRELWVESGNSESLRVTAFRLWLRNVDYEKVNVLETIRMLKPGDALFAEAIRERARLEDRSCVSDLASALESDTSLFGVAHYVWSPEVYGVAEGHLARCQDMPADFSGGWENHHYHLAYLLTEIPPADAERLLEKHWDHLQYGPLFVQSALHVGTPRCLELADQVIVECPDDVDMFRHFSLRFPLTPIAAGDVSTLDRIPSLGKYWHRFDEYLLDQFVEACYESGDEERAWCQEHLPESINERYRLRYCPTDDDLIKMLEESIGFARTSIDMWMRELTKHVDPARIMRVLRQWLESEPTFQRVQLAMHCIEMIGRRQDLDMLDHAMEHLEHRWMLEPQIESVKFDVRRRTLQ